MASLLSRGLPLAFALLAMSAFGEPAAPPAEKDPPAVDQAAVDAAVAKGAEWLRARVKEGLPGIKDYSLDEIILYALVHAGVDRGDADVVKLVQEIHGKPPSRTYTAALRAMAFSLYDPVKLRADLVQCAEFLVNNQGQNGQWGYGQPIEQRPLPKVIITGSDKPPNYALAESTGSGRGPSTSSGQGAGKPGQAPSAKSGGTQTRQKPPRQQLTRRGWGNPNDNSNTQYALLGLGACMAEGIVPPADCLQRAEEWWRKQQNDNGGWSYQDKGMVSTGSMSAGGVSSLAIILREAGHSPLQDPAETRGVDWLGKNLTFDQNPGAKAGASDYYWIYAIERAGAMAGTEWFGGHAWYPEGVAWLLAHQKADGAWDGDMTLLGEGTCANDVLDTCWAILFLRRATRHIVLKKIYTQ